LAGLGLYELLGHRLRPLLLVAVVPAVLSVLLVRAVREGPPPVRRTAQVSATPLPGRLRLLVGVLTVFALVNFPDALLLLRASELGLGTAGVIAAYVVYNLVYAVLSYPAGSLSDRFPRHLVFAAGLVSFVCGYIGLALAPSAGWVFVILPVYGGFAACTDGVGKAWVASLAPGGRQGSAQGIYQGLTGAGILVAGIWAGFAWHGDGRLPLLVSGLAGALLAVVLGAGGRRLSQPAPMAAA